jgi:hypothetical protein
MNQGNSTGLSVPELARQIQYNCHIADANHGGDYTLCVYLMRMREYYRWEMGRGFGDRLGKEEVGDWLVEREGLWQELDGVPFQHLELDGERCDPHGRGKCWERQERFQYDPFDAGAVNGRLAELGLVYGGGLGRTGRPHFFLAEELQRERLEGYELVVSGRELARDLTAPPGLSQGRTILIRRESLKRLLWEKLEGWRWSSLDNAMGRALACYDFDHALEASLERMTDVETETVLWHEIGEVQAGELLGVGWEPMLESLLFTPAELMCRAVRDHLADCLVTLPRLLERGEAPSIHFYLGNLSHMRRALCPALDVAYQSWRRDGGLGALRELRERGLDHWRRLAGDILAIHAGAGDGSAKAIAEHVAARHLVV